jgi:sugar phosphate isomerase/epimerase
MNLAISNIAWRPEENAAIYPMLTEVGVRGLEIAPGLAFAEAADPFSPTEAEISHFRSEIDAHRLKPVSMQSLMFRAENARLFGDARARTAFETRLEEAIALAKRLEIPNLVVGSPTHRAIPAGMDRANAERIACAVFRRLGDKAGAAKTKLALEPNPATYGTNFLTTMDETITFAALVDHPAVTLNFDIGALHMNGEAGSAMALYRRGGSKVSHVHVSEPNLSPAPQCEATFGAIAQDLIRNGYGGWFSIEMRPIGEYNRDNVRARAESCARQLRSAIA